jgi:hypothetical protein
MGHTRMCGAQPPGALSPWGVFRRRSAMALLRRCLWRSYDSIVGRGFMCRPVFLRAAQRSSIGG